MLRFFNPKKCRFIEITRGWPWTLESSKGCETTNLADLLRANSPASGITSENGWRSSGIRHYTGWATWHSKMTGIAWRFFRSIRANVRGTMAYADLGVSSKCCSKNLNGRSGEDFHVNIDSASVSPSLPTWQ